MTIEKKSSNSNKENERLANNKGNKFIKNKILSGITLIVTICLVFCTGCELGSIDYSEADETAIKFEQETWLEKTKYEYLHPDSSYKGKLEPWEERSVDPVYKNQVITDYTMIRYPKDENTVYYYLEYFDAYGKEEIAYLKLSKTDEGWKVVYPVNMTEYHLETKKIEPQVVRYASH